MEIMNLWWLLIPVSYALGTFPTAQIVAGFVGHDPTAEGLVILARQTSIVLPEQKRE